MGDIVHVNFRWRTERLSRHVEVPKGAIVLPFPPKLLAILRRHMLRNRHEGRATTRAFSTSARLIPPVSWP